MGTEYKSPRAKPGSDRQWSLIDADGQVLGRLSTSIATMLQGKDRPDYTPGVDTGHFVIVVNADKVRVTGKKANMKVYHDHSRYPGGMKKTPYLRMLEKKPEDIIRRAVKNMLPKNRLGRTLMTKLKIYAGADHPHKAQNPQVAGVNQ